MKQVWIQTEPERAYAWLYWLKEIKLMMFTLDMLDCPVYSLLLSTLNFLCWMGWGDHSKSVLLFGFLCGTLPSCLKVMGGWVVGGLQDFSVSPGSESLSLCHWAWVTEPEFEPDWAWVPEPSLSLTIVSICWVRSTFMFSWKNQFWNKGCVCVFPCNTHTHSPLKVLWCYS